VSRWDYDHSAALALYVGLEPPNRTYAEVARRIGASETSVRRWAREEAWDEQLAAAMRRGVSKALKSREERTAQLLRIYERAAQQVEDALDPDEPLLAIEVVFAKFPEIHRIYRLETEQATDHVALAEVQAGFRTAMRVAIATNDRVVDEAGLPPVKAAGLKRSFRESFLPAVNEALAIGGGE
jgi:hypothetical protein